MSSLTLIPAGSLNKHAKSCQGGQLPPTLPTLTRLRLLSNCCAAFCFAVVFVKGRGTAGERGLISEPLSMTSVLSALVDRAGYRAHVNIICIHSQVLSLWACQKIVMSNGVTGNHWLKVWHNFVIFFSSKWNTMSHPA